MVKILGAEWTTQWRCLEKKTQRWEEKLLVVIVVLSTIFSLYLKSDATLTEPYFLRSIDWAVGKQNGTVNSSSSSTYGVLEVWCPFRPVLGQSIRSKLFPLGPGVVRRREALYRPVVIVDELSILLCALQLWPARCLHYYLVSVLLSVSETFFLLVSVLLSAREVAVCRRLPDLNL